MNKEKMAYYVFGAFWSALIPTLSPFLSEAKGAEKFDLYLRAGAEVGRVAGGAFIALNGDPVLGLAVYSLIGAGLGVEALRYEPGSN